VTTDDLMLAVLVVAVLAAIVLFILGPRS